MTPERFAKLQSALVRRQPDLTVLLDDVNKPHNVSAIVRSADAVGIARMHAVSTHPVMRRHHDLAGGAKHWVAVQLHRSSEAAVAALRAEGWRLVVADSAPGALDFREVDYTARVAIVLGAELHGVSPAALAAANDRVAIPMLGLGTSVNVSVAAGAILLEAQRQRLAAGLYRSSRLSGQERERLLFEWAYPEVAARCRQLGRPYPALREDGLMASNPLGDSRATSA
jgi:tRNA (guanosine-2'-O-)-methyltransferase